MIKYIIPDKTYNAVLQRSYKIHRGKLVNPQDKELIGVVKEA